MKPKPNRIKDAEFDEFAVNYENLHRSNVAISGEQPAFFAEYKIADARVVADFIGLPENLRILDFGSGTGSSLPYFEKYFPSGEIICLDPSYESLRVALGNRTKRCAFVQADGRQLPFDVNKPFDMIFSACVFHHIDHSDHFAILHSLYSVLRPGGVLMLYEHNPLNPLTRYAVATCPFDKNAKLVRPTDLRVAFREVGLRDVALRHRLFFPRALKAMRGLESWLTWLPLGAQYYVFGVR